jgi:hypothetical protein
VTITADTQAGPVFVYVAAALELQSPVDAGGGHESSVMFVYLGAGTVAVRAPLAATIVAPGAALDLEPPGSQGVRGIKQSQGAFGQWSGALPPNPLNVVNPTQTDVTRVAATMSQLLRREVDTHGAMSIQRALIDQAGVNPTHVSDPGEIDAVTNQVCPEVNDTCAGDPISYRGQVGCDGGQPPENCRLSDDRWKMTIAHEIGHVIQRRASGVWNALYKFNGDKDNDIPGAPPVCRCDHVGIANGWHCLQSLERSSTAQVEGYAQYFASKTWNDIAQNDCTFVYYKEFLSTQCLPGEDPAACTADPGNPGSSSMHHRWRSTA